MSSVKVLKKIRITDIGMDSKHVYVVNNTRGEKKGNVLVSCPKTNGVGEDCIMVEESWIPMDMLEQVSIKQIMESSDFRKLVYSEILLLVPEDEAQRLMGRKGYAEERARIVRMRQTGSVMTQNEALEDSLLQVSTDLDSRNSAREGIAVKTKFVIKGIENTGEVGAINVFRNREEDMNEEDWRYVIRMAKKGGYKKLHKYATARLDEWLESQGMEEEEDDED